MIANRADFGENVAGKNNRLVFSELSDQIADLNDLFGIKSDRRLVQNNDIGISQKRLGNSDTLAVSLGEIADQPVFNIGKRGQFHDVIDL